MTEWIPVTVNKMLELTAVPALLVFNFRGMFMSRWHVILQTSGVSSNNYVCTCAYGFTGFDCEEKLDECVLKNCSDCVNGTCQCPIGEFILMCTHRFT